MHWLSIEKKDVNPAFDYNEAISWPGTTVDCSPSKRMEQIMFNSMKDIRPKFIYATTFENLKGSCEFCCDIFYLKAQCLL